MKLFPILLLAGTACFGQIKDITKDTLQLDEVTVTNSGNKKIRKIKLEGSCSYPENMKDAQEIITLVEDIPEGNVGKVAFYFNKIDTETYRRNSEHFKESDFEIVLYDVNTDGMPGMPSAIEQQVMIVDKAHKGKVTVDLSLFNIETQKKMFIGLRKLTSSNDAKGFMVDCLCSGQSRYMTYYRENSSSTWERRWPCAALKLEVNVEVKNKKTPK